MIVPVTGELVFPPWKTFLQDDVELEQREIGRHKHGAPNGPSIVRLGVTRVSYGRARLENRLEDIKLLRGDARHGEFFFFFFFKENR